MVTIERISEQSKVKIVYENGWYTATHFKNGCSRGLEVKQSTSREEITAFVEKLKEIFGDENN